MGYAEVPYLWSSYRSWQNLDDTAYGVGYGQLAGMSYIEVPYLYSCYNGSSVDVPGYYPGTITPGLGQAVASYLLEDWAGLMPAFSITSETFSGPYTVASPSNMVQGIFLSPDDGTWHYGGWSWVLVPEYTIDGTIYTDCWYWEFQDWGSLGDIPSETSGIVSSSLCSFGSLAMPGVSSLSGWNLGVYGLPANGDSGYFTVLANVDQGGPPGDFWLLCIGMESTPPATFIPWQRPNTTDDGPGAGGPTIPASDVLSGYEAMNVYGPLGIGLLNAFGFIVGVQGSNTDGSGPSPLYLYCLAQTGAGWSGDGDFGNWLLTTDLPACPAPAGGVITPGCGLSLNWSNGPGYNNPAYPQPLALLSNCNLWAYQPNGDGTYSPWELDFVTSTWAKLDVSWDVQPIAGGFWVTADNSTLYVVGYSPTTYRANVALEYVIGTGTTTKLAGSPNSTAQCQDGYAKPNPGYQSTWSAGPLQPGVPASQLSTINTPLTACTNGFIVDRSYAPYIYPPDPGSPQGGNWLRAFAAGQLYGRPNIPPVRMLQRSDGFGVRMRQLDASANAPSSLRMPGSGNAHI